MSCETDDTGESQKNGQGPYLLEVLQLCSYPVIGWLDVSPDLSGLRSIQVAPI
jgi:hypothetical protein